MGTRNGMGLGVSIFWIAVGAVLRFAVEWDNASINIHTIGDVLMIVGLIGVGVSVFLWNSWGGRGLGGRRTVVTEQRSSELL